MTLKAGAATVDADYENAKRDAEANKELNKIGVLSDSALKASLAKAHEMEVRHQIEQERIAESTEAVRTQLAVQQANIDQKLALAQLRNKQLDSLKVRAGISGVLQELPVQVGQRVAQGAILAKVVQPIAQILASVPATAFFPVLLMGLVRIGGGLGIGSIALMLLGTQWYILFNVIAGAMSIPSDLREVASLYRFTRWQRWTRLILPGIFPYLLTGMVTASGGAWNASVMAEYSHVKDRTLETIGLGAQIDAATDTGRFAILLLATIMISLIVITMNRLVWRRLYRLAETRYKLG